MSRTTSTSESQRLYSRAKQIIPGGTQLLSKRPEMYAPERWPAYYRSAAGCEIIDLDGNTFLDMSLMGIGACLLGYADPDVTAAVVRRVHDGSMCTLNPPDEVHLAEELLALHSWADQARFARTGGEAMAIAVRIARGATGRDLVVFCGYHGWHDWYLAANRTPTGDSDALNSHLLPGLSPVGVPSQLAGTTLTFGYNEIDALARIARDNGKNLAAVVIEPTRSLEPEPGFLEGVREICDHCGAALIADEISAGWRFAPGGSHLKYRLQPDIAVFAKALGNGHPIAAIIGRAPTMQAAQGTFISSTYWTEGVGPAAALATIRKLRSHDVPTHISHIGTRLRDGLQQVSQQHRLAIKVSGHPALTSIAFEHPAATPLLTLFTIRMMDHGILCGGSFYPSWAHEERHVDSYLKAADGVFDELVDAATRNDVMERIDGLVKHTSFARLA